MSEAIEFFSDKSIAKDKCKYLAEEYARSLTWEKEKVSIHSPGTVQNDEKIARQIHSPHSYDQESGKLTTFAFDDMFNKALSVNRLSFTDTEELHDVGENRAEKARESNPKREYVGLSIAEVTEVRSCYEGLERWFAVYDTSNEDDISHADVCCVYPKKDSPGRKGLKRRQAELLQRIFSKVVKPEKIKQVKN